MDPEAIFLAGYALILVVVAAGLASLGRRTADPWSSRVLAASRPPRGDEADPAAEWPHCEVPAFHLGVSAVVLAAALLLTAVSVARNHRPLELVVQLALVVVIAIRMARVVSQRRALAR